MKFQSVGARVSVVLLLLANHLYSAPQQNTLPLSDRVLIVYNPQIPASQEVADYYASKRNIPATNKCAIITAEAATIDWYEFETRIKTPIKSCLNTVGKEQILYIVFATQTPYRIHNVPVAAGRELRALDSFVAEIWNDNTAEATELRSHPYFAEIQSQGNVYSPFVSLAEYRNQPGAALLYSVWRLDAATADLAKGLVDKALLAEANGLQGQGCFDRRFGSVTTLDWDVMAQAIGMCFVRRTSPNKQVLP